jgi:hypothetical protein
MVNKPTKIIKDRPLDVINRLLYLNKMVIDDIEEGTFEYDMAVQYQMALIQAKFATINPSQFDLNKNRELRDILREE